MGTRLFKERTRAGLTQKTLAEKVGISRVSIVKYETGKTLPSAEALAGFETVGLDVRYILVEKRTATMKEIRNQFRKAFEQVSRQALVNGEILSDEKRLDFSWCVYDAWSVLELKNN